MTKFTKLLILALFATITSKSVAQNQITSVCIKEKDLSTPVVAFKTNVLYDLTSTINLGVEVGLGQRTSLDVSANYNGWTFNDDKMVRNWLVQPEFRYWLDKRFYGHFFGLHPFYGGYNMAGVDFLGMADKRYQGEMCGVGFAYGYQFRIGRNWNLELTAGLGYARLRYNEYDWNNCGKLLDTKTQNYFGLTKLGVSFVLLIR